jgi:predicted dehydrogenase
MTAEVKIALVGIGGYGHHYLRHLLHAPAERHIRLVAGIDPAPERCEFLQKLQEANIPLYADLESFYAESSADLAIICTPIHWHTPLTCLALSHGSNVLCEKPVAATIQDADKMAKAEATSPGAVAIGYQWSFSDAIQALKRDVLAGDLGRPLRLRTKAFWPRSTSYFSRADWAGKIKTSAGQWILDSTVNNATAHHLHNMFYILGDTPQTSAQSVNVQAELYRANEIESYDAAALRCHTQQGIEILFYTAHCVPSLIGPVANYEFEHAVVEYAPEGSFLARFHNGHIRDYGDPDATMLNKLWQSVNVARTGGAVACGIKAATSHTLCVNGAQESMWEIAGFPQKLVKMGEWQKENFIWVDGLQEVFEACYDQGVLPSEQGGISWAREGEIIDLREYRFFPSFRNDDESVAVSNG